MACFRGPLPPPSWALGCEHPSQKLTPKHPRRRREALLPLPERCSGHRGTHGRNTFCLRFCEVWVSGGCHKTSKTTVCIPSA